MSTGPKIGIVGGSRALARKRLSDPDAREQGQRDADCQIFANLHVPTNRTRVMNQARPDSPREQQPRPALVLTSGGLDSTTVLAIARAEGFVPLALTFHYGQTHDVEVERARQIAAEAEVAEHLVLELPLGQIGGSSLLGQGSIPDEDLAETREPEIPSTYVPARNLIFLSLAAGVAEARAIRDIFVGVNALDYSGYPDCRPEFIESFQRTVNLGTREGSTREEPWFRVHMPLVDLRKSEIIQRGLALGVDYSRTVSCYQADDEGRACGRCEACGLRRRGFEEAGTPDPTLYQNGRS